MPFVQQQRQLSDRLIWPLPQELPRDNSRPINRLFKERPAAKAVLELEMADNVLKRRKARVAQCRRLAASTTDQRAANILRQMADEGEADIKRLEPSEPK